MPGVRSSGQELSAGRRFAEGRRWLRAVVMLLCLVPGGAAAAPQARLFVISNGWHTEIGVPAGVLGARLGAVRAAFPEAHYFVFGFGERAFYMSRAPTWTEALRALLPARAVVLVLGLGTVPTRAFSAGVTVTPLPLPPAGRQALASYLWQSFARRPAGRPERLGAGPYAASAFYAASGTYDGGHTCNTWSAEALKRAGLPVHPAGVVFAAQLMRQVRALAADPPPRR